MNILFPGICKKCKTPFEVTVHLSDDNWAEYICPKCKTKNKLFSNGSVWLRTYMNAEKLLRDGEYRNAIVEIFSAWEIFIPFATKYELMERRTDKKIIEIFMNIFEKSRDREPAQLVFASLTGLDINKIDAKVSELRNKVVHKGKIPTPQEAENAVDLIRQFIHVTYGDPRKNINKINDLFKDEKFWSINTPEDE